MKENVNGSLLFTSNAVLKPMSNPRMENGNKDDDNKMMITTGLARELRCSVRVM